MNIREFQKYKARGAYHWEQIGFNLLKRNAYVIARYYNLITLLKIHLGDLNGKAILDAGCGDGVLSFLLAKEGAKVVGVDYSKDAINFAIEKVSTLKNISIDFKVGSVMALPLSESSYDAIVSSDVIEHLDNTPQFLSEIKRVAKRGAVVIISTPIRFTEKPLDVEHVIEWFPGEYKTLIEDFFGKSYFHTSHPISLLELFQSRYFGKMWARLLINLISVVWNPFRGFSGRFRHHSLQFSVSKVNK